VKNGADVIKAAVSGGVLSLADEVDTPQLTPAEMAALVDESHRLRKKVACTVTAIRPRAMQLRQASIRLSMVLLCNQKRLPG